VGYGRAMKAEKSMLIGVINVGYADGISRQWGNGRCKLLVNGHPAPIIGNVCMDMCMLDVTGLNVKEGDEVILFGEQLPIQQITFEANTIPHETLASISRRVKRVYYYE